MSGIEIIRRALYSVMLMTRPKLVSTISAPSLCARSAIAKAMLAGVRTPVTRIFFPSRMPGMAVRFYRSRLEWPERPRRKLWSPVDLHGYDKRVEVAGGSPRPASWGGAPDRLRLRLSGDRPACSGGQLVGPTLRWSSRRRHCDPGGGRLTQPRVNPGRLGSRAQSPGRGLDCRRTDLVL